MHMKRLSAAALALALASPVWAQDEVKLGVLMGFTGPTESLVPVILGGVELAAEEVTKSGKLLGGKSVSLVTGDSTCVDATVATTAAKRLIEAEEVSGIVGTICSGAATAVINNVAVPNEVVMISPTASSPALTTISDNGLFFRTAPSDARQSEVIAELLTERGVKSVAVTYTNNDFGKGASEAFRDSFTKLGGNVTIEAPHEDGKADYAAELGALSAAGGEALFVIGYADQGGKGIIQASLDTAAFDTYVLAASMIGDSLAEAFGKEINGSWGVIAGSDGPGIELLGKLAEGKSFSANEPYVAEGYDATALILLAMQAAKSTESGDYKEHIMVIANEPGEKIYPGELGKALDILAQGGEINYEGGSSVHLVDPGESAGSFREEIVKGGKFETAGFH